MMLWEVFLFETLLSELNLSDSPVLTREKRSALL